MIHSLFEKQMESADFTQGPLPSSYASSTSIYVTQSSSLLLNQLHYSCPHTFTKINQASQFKVRPLDSVICNGNILAPPPPHLEL